MRWLTFRIFHAAAEKQGLRFAIRQSQAVESIPFTGVIPQPGAPDALLGTLDYHGRVVRVFDLGVMLGLGPGLLPQRVRLLIARQTRVSAPIAIAVQPELEEVGKEALVSLRIVDLRELARLAAGYARRSS